MTLAVLKNKVEKFQLILAPKIKLVKTRWEQLLPRERMLLLGLGVFLALSLVYLTIVGLIKYKNSLELDVINLKRFSLYSTQAAQTYKQLSKIEANKVSTPSIDQIKSDVKQVLDTDNPNVSLQDSQISINIPNAPFNKVMALLDQFRRSYGMYPAQINIIRQSQDGYVSLNAMFWMNQ